MLNIAVAGFKHTTTRVESHILAARSLGSSSLRQGDASGTGVGLLCSAARSGARHLARSIRNSDEEAVKTTVFSDCRRGVLLAVILLNSSMNHTHFHKGVLHFRQVSGNSISADPAENKK